MSDTETRDAMLVRIRERMKNKQGGRVRDPAEFQAKKPPKGKTVAFKFIILPPYEVGNVIAGGHEVVAGDVERTSELWYYVAGTHWINSRPYECPRSHDDEKCPMCDLGFQLMEDVEDKDERRQIANDYLARQRFVVNIYFPPYASCPDDLKDKVMWYSMPKSVFEMMEACIYRDGGGDEEDPKAFGLFFEPENSYVFKLEVYGKSDKFPSYEQSKFLIQTLGPIVELDGGKADHDKINEVLSGRHLLHAKFADRDQSKLQELVDDVMNKDGRGFDDVEDDDKPKSAAKSKPDSEPKTKPDPEDKPKSAVKTKPDPEDKPKSAVKTKPDPEDSESAKTKDDSDMSDDELKDLLNEIKGGE